ncbi:hypothetical protein DV515_00018842 [Chloebia gouldiae]|uniref:Fibronectin type-III domain-containing protein n=1 Tax=Chloebia gouldiae TaxID=44316 RepID=A0A3L8Q6D2_CHLGU|nr:hypothetical protein DV515_00018842 [Chloebia gouldiae]
MQEKRWCRKHLLEVTGANSGMIPEPQNARISSVNLHSTLQWDAPRFPRGNLTYTVQSKSTYYPGDAFGTLRTGLRLPCCDLSSLSPYGSYVLQLRAEAGQLRSPWVTLTFKPMDDSEPVPFLPKNTACSAREARGCSVLHFMMLCWFLASFPRLSRGRD